MNPKITIKVDSKSKAVASFDGIASVGSKVDIEIIGLPSGIETFGSGDDFTGPSVRFRVLDDDGNDVVRYPLEKKTSTKVSGGDQWTKTVVSGADVYHNSSGCVVDFDTDRLREMFDGEVYDSSVTLGVIIDSAVDKAEFAVGRMKVRQWLTPSVDDPTVLPNWTDIQQKLNNASASVTKVGNTATISITDTHGSTTTSTVTDGDDGSVVSVSPTGTSTDEVNYITIDGTEKKLGGGGDMKHSDFSSLDPDKSSLADVITLLKGV